MRWSLTPLATIVVAFVAAFGGTARADSRTDMARALAAHADLAPPPAVLPGTKIANITATAPTARTVPTRPDPGNGKGHGDGTGDASSLAHRAEEAAANAAEHAQ